MYTKLIHVHTTEEIKFGHFIDRHKGGLVSDSGAFERFLVVGATDQTARDEVTLGAAVLCRLFRAHHTIPQSIISNKCSQNLDTGNI